MPPTSRAASRLRSVPPENKPPAKPVSNSRKRAASIAAGGEDEKAPPRKRGRPAKNAPATDKEPTKENVAQNLTDGDDKTAPRKRGRPPKIARATADGTVKEQVALNLAPRLCFVFGTGDFGQFGLGTETLGEISRPRLHAWFETAAKGDILGSEGAGVEKICAGGMHTLAIDEAGKVWSWGINDNASLGRPTADVPDPDNPKETLEAEILETQPMVIQTLVDENFRAVAVSAGDSVSVALGHEGDLRVWGSFRSSDGLLGFDGKPGSSKTQITPLPIPALTPYQFVSVVCGTDHVVALTTAGHVYTWGSGQAAQLGRRIIERRKVNGLSPERLALRNIVLIGTGNYHSFAVNAKGIVFAWGLNSLKQTGVSEDRGGDEDIIWQPTEVDALHPAKLGGRKVVQISGGDHHSLFLLDDGSVWGCGRCDGREVGLADDHPAMKELATRKDAAREAIEKAAKEAKETDTSTNADGEAPTIPTVVDEFIPEPVPILFPPPPTADDNNPPLPSFSADMISNPPINPIAHLSAGTRHNLAISRDGNAYSWGSGNGCELGLGPDTEAQPVPSRVKSKALDGWKVEMAGAGGQHCVLLAVKPGEV
ncbi:regulator of chromosome condensation 1/beta-lactamase-inhibitor protein II [Gautieria morchelliformis]|nr:regulator of chromosome condensation 1/beta-lactamase-inhibitor protein II [Gautieria morchelliformis]